LLPFIVPPTGVRDRNFVNSVTTLENLGGQLGLDAKAVGFERERSQYFRPHYLVTGFHVGEHRVVQDVGGERDDTIAKVGGKQKPSMPSEKPGAVNHVGRALANQLDQ